MVLLVVWLTQHYACSRAHQTFREIFINLLVYPISFPLSPLVDHLFHVYFFIFIFPAQSFSDMPIWFRWLSGHRALAYRAPARCGAVDTLPSSKHSKQSEHGRECRDKQTKPFLGERQRSAFFGTHSDPLTGFRRHSKVPSKAFQGLHGTEPT